MTTTTKLPHPPFLAFPHSPPAKILVDAGSIIDHASNTYAWTAAYLASSHGYPRILTLLIKAGADVNLADKDGWTPLYAAACCIERPLIICLRIITVLAEAGAALNQEDNDGWAPIHTATSRGHAPIVEKLSTLVRRPLLYRFL